MRDSLEDMFGRLVDINSQIDRLKELVKATEAGLATDERCEQALLGTGVLFKGKVYQKLYNPDINGYCLGVKEQVQLIPAPVTLDLEWRKNHDSN